MTEHVVAFFILCVEKKEVKMDIKKLDMVAEYYSTEGSVYKCATELAKEGKVYVSETDPDKRLRFKM